MAMKIGVDTGGTFTDFMLLDDERLVIHKVLSTPDNPARAVLQGLRHLLPALSGVNIVHGSTVATNALLERKGARTALITTRGFEDVLEIGRQTRPDLYDPFVTKLPPLVPARLLSIPRPPIASQPPALSYSVRFGRIPPPSYS